MAQAGNQGRNSHGVEKKGEIWKMLRISNRQCLLLTRDDGGCLNGCSVSGLYYWVPSGTVNHCREKRRIKFYLGKVITSDGCTWQAVVIRSGSQQRPRLEMKFQVSLLYGY